MAGSLGEATADGGIRQAGDKRVIDHAVAGLSSRAATPPLWKASIALTNFEAVKPRREEWTAPPKSVLMWKNPLTRARWSRRSKPTNPTPPTCRHYRRTVQLRPAQSGLDSVAEGCPVRAGRFFLGADAGTVRMARSDEDRGGWAFGTGHTKPPHSLAA